jgi:transcriptional regulator with GAF, ATPase, and Fis domain
MTGSHQGYYDSVRATKRNIIRSAVEQISANYGEAARLLGIHVNNLHRLIREFDLKLVLEAARSFLLR